MIVWLCGWWMVTASVLFVVLWWFGTVMVILGMLLGFWVSCPCCSWWVRLVVLLVGVLVWCLGIV